MDNREHESEVRGLPLEHALTETGDRTSALVWLGVSVATATAVVLLALVIDDVPLWAYFVLAIAVLATVVTALLAVRVWATWSNPQLFLPSSEPLHLGDRVVVRFRRTARGASDPAGLSMSAAVRVTEVASLGAGRQAQVERRRVYEAPVSVDMQLAGRTVEADLRIDVPLFDAPPSMDLGNNEVHWELWVRMQAPNAPDDDTTFPLTVAPVVAGRLLTGTTDA